jgi:hypothetical protein
MVNFCVPKTLLFHYCLLSLCLVTYKTYPVSSIVILCTVIVSNICNKQNSIIINVTIKILLFLDVYYNRFTPLYFVCSVYVNINSKFNDVTTLLS